MVIKKLTLLILCMFLAWMSCRKEMPAIIKVNTLAASDIMATSATLNGEIVDAGEGVIDYGHCWAKHSNPNIADFLSTFQYTDDTDSIKSEIQDLEPATKYYFRTWAEGDDGIPKYGDILDFTTTDGRASIITKPVTQIMANSAQCGGDIISVNGDIVIGKGVCWDTRQTFDLTDCIGYTNDGSGMESFTSDITGLSNNKDYFVQSYAITSVDTSYGGTKHFTTLDGIPLVTTEAVTEIDATTAQSGGDVTEDWGSTITRRGIVWDTDPEPMLENCEGYTEDGAGTGTFVSTLINLSCTTYYCRAYAENEYGTGYGEDEIEFTTYIQDTRDGDEYKWVVIGDQIWMAENLAYLPSVNPTSSWSDTAPLYYVYGYEGTNTVEAKATNNYQTYGVLYNWPAALGACPDGWHLPSDVEWKQLEMQLGMSQIEANSEGFRGTNEGSKLAGDSSLWPDGDLKNNSAFGSSGFRALPGGMRHGGNLVWIGDVGYFWTASETSDYSAWQRWISGGASTVTRFDREKTTGISVRCLKD